MYVLVAQGDDYVRTESAFVLPYDQFCPEMYQQAWIQRESYEENSHVRSPPRHVLVIQLPRCPPALIHKAETTANFAWLHHVVSEFFLSIGFNRIHLPMVPSASTSKLWLTDSRPNNESKSTDRYMF